MRIWITAAALALTIPAHAAEGFFRSVESAPHEAEQLAVKDIQDEDTAPCILHVRFNAPAPRSQELAYQGGLENCLPTALSVIRQAAGAKAAKYDIGVSRPALKPPPWQCETNVLWGPAVPNVVVIHHLGDAACEPAHHEALVEAAGLVQCFVAGGACPQ